MYSYTVVGYTYEADVHCIECTCKRFGIDPESQIDNEGNPVHPIFAGDEFDIDTNCGDCFREIDTCYIGPVCDNCGGHHFTSECNSAPEELPEPDCEN